MYRRLSVIVVVSVCLFAGAGKVQAQSPDEVMLSLDDCLRLALKNNLSLVSAAYAPEITSQDVETQEAPFDPVFQARYFHRKSEQPPIQGSSVTASIQDTISASSTQNMKIGGSYSVSFSTTKFLQDAPNVFAPESFISGLGFNFTMPLLKGRGKEQATALLVLARGNVAVSEADLERQAELTLEQVEGAYWDVVAAREGVRIAHLARKRAEELLELNRKKVEVGTLAPIEITQAEAGVASEVENVIIAEQTLLDAEDELRRLLAIPASDSAWDKRIINSTQPEYTELTIDLPAAMDQALEERAEMRSARQTVANNELSERSAKKDRRHQLDLVLDYNPQGSNLTLQDPSTQSIISQGNYGRSTVNIFEQTEDNWTGTLTYTVPLGNRAANASFTRARLSRERSEVDLADQAQTIRVEVRRSARAVTSGIQRVEAAQTNVRLQGEKLEAEQKKFENGMSTSFEVLTFQRDLANAELSEINARLAYIKALAAFERSKGTLLESHGLKISDR